MILAVDSSPSAISARLSAAHSREHPVRHRHLRPYSGHPHRRIELSRHVRLWDPDHCPYANHSAAAANPGNTRATASRDTVSGPG